jgi:hypothetical protein
MEPHTYNSSTVTLGNITSGNGYLLTSDNTLKVSPYNQPTISTNTVTFNTPINYSTNFSINTIMQNKVAVFKVTRNEDNRITNTEFIKELWVQTKNNQSVEFQVARDKDLADYDVNDLIIKVLLTVTF